MLSHTKFFALLNRNKKHIPGGVVSVNRAVQPEIAFVRDEGAYIWDADGNRYIDYHAAFAPHLILTRDQTCALPEDAPLCLGDVRIVVSQISDTLGQRA